MISKYKNSTYTLTQNLKQLTDNILGGKTTKFQNIPKAILGGGRLKNTYINETILKCTDFPGRSLLQTTDS